MRLLSLAIAAFLMSGVWAQDATYPVQFSVPSKVGDRRKVDQVRTQLLHRLIKKADKVVKEQKSNNKIEFKAAIEVLGVDAKGRETKLQITVEKFVLIADGGEPQEALKPGSVVLAETRRGKTVFAPKDKESKLSRLAEHLLPRIISTHRGEITDEDVFNNDKPQKLGAAWPADPKQLAEQLKDLGKFDKLSGTAKLLGVKTLNGTKCLELQATASAKGPGQAEGDLLVPESVSLQFALRRLIPANYSTGPLEENLEVNMVQILKGKPGSPNAGLLFDGRSTDTATIKTIYLKK